jgi:hypothetical protein
VVADRGHAHAGGGGDVADGRAVVALFRTATATFASSPEGVQRIDFAEVHHLDFWEELNA